MSDLKFTCPHCKQSLEAPEEMLGQVIDCPSCSKQIQVPKPQARTAPQVALQNVGVEIKRGSSPLGIAALVIGILACLTCWIPVIGLLTIPLSLIGILLALIGLIMAAVSKKTGFVFPISGGLVCVIAIAIAVVTTGGFTKAVSDATASTETVAAEPSETASPEPAAPREAETAALVAEARQAFVNGNFAKAEELYQKFVEQQPDNVVALANLGVAQFRQGKLTAAQLALERAIKADPNDAFSLTTLGAVMIEQDRIDDAIGYLERANEAQADDPITLNYLGVASSQVGQFGKAEQSLRRAITVKPEYAEAHFNLAVIYATAKPPSIALAKRHYEKALELGSSPDQRLATMLQSAPGS